MDASSIMDYHRAAERYRPSRVDVLFVAESPPAFTSVAKRAYFFFKDNPGGDLLFATIVQAVLDVEYRKHGPVPKEDVLRRFQREGFWLIDAVEYPINKINDRKTPDHERKRLIENERNNLLERIGKLHTKNRGDPMKIVLIKNLVYECLSGTLRQVGYDVPQIGAIGFPRWHRDPATIEGIRSALQIRCA